MINSSIIFFGIAAIVCICAMLAAMGFRGRINTVGIDLGTTFSVIGYQASNGTVVIIKDKQGRPIIPSMVSYQPDGSKLVGYDAHAVAKTQPLNTIYNSKRFIGKSLEEEDTQLYAASHDFKVVPYLEGNYSKVAFEIPMGKSSKLVTPEEVGSDILKHLLDIAHNFLGYNTITRAVIAVPAKFDSLQRQAIGEAYKKAGLKVMRVIEEPTAAAVAYGLHKKKNVSHILVYDFGGGTLDVSILYVSQGSVQVYATDGDDTLGGSDFDVCLAENIKKKMEEHKPYKGISNLSNNKKISLCDSSSIHQEAENIKKLFSKSEKVTFSCKNEKIDEYYSFDLSRDESFYEGCSYLFDRTLLPVKRLLTELDMSVDVIDEVVLVGGSTRMPRVKELLHDFFQQDLNDEIDPDVTVAYGASSILD